MTTAGEAYEKGKQFRLAVLRLFEMLYDIGDEKVRLAVWTFAQTQYWYEFEEFKKFSLDEYVHGRKNKEGERYTEGCHMKSRANVNRGLLALEKLGYLEIKRDAKDRARRMRYYRLRLPSLDTVVTTDYSEEEPSKAVVSSDYSPPQNKDVSVVTTDYTLESVVTTGCSHQRLLDQSKYLSKVSSEVPTIAADATKAIPFHPLKLVEIEKEKEERQIAPVSPELESLWTVVRSELQAGETPATIENWLAPLKVAGAEGPVLYLQANNSFIPQMFQNRFAERASAILSRLVHEEAEVRCLPPIGRSSA